MTLRTALRRVVSAASPDRGDEIVLADDALPVADQIVEQVEYLRRNGDDVVPATELPLGGVEHEVLEEIEQSRFPSPGPSEGSPA
jgi:hypothetical protein